MSLPKKLDFDLLLLNIDFYNSIYKSKTIFFLQLLFRKWIFTFFFFKNDFL